MGKCVCARFSLRRSPYCIQSAHSVCCQAVKTDDSNPQANGIGGDNEQGEAGPSNDSQVVLETETGLDKVESIDQFEYIEPVPDPYNKAIKYLEQHSILQLFQVCIFKENVFGFKIYNNFADTK